MKHIELVIIQVIGNVEDEQTFSTLIFTKFNPSCGINWLGIWILPYTCLFKSFSLKKILIFKLLLEFGMMEMN